MKEVNRKVSGATVNAGTLDNLAALPTNAPTVTNAPKTSQSQTHPQGCFWLDVFNPTEAELRLLSKVFGIHPLTIEDIEHQEIREKCDMFRSYYFVVTRFVVHPDDQIDEDDEEDGASVYSIVRKEGIISFHYRPLRDLPTVHDRLTRLSPFLSITPDWIHYALLDAITDSFAPIVDGVEMEVSNIDELVLVLHESEQSDMLRRIGQCRKDVNMMLRLLGGKMDMVRGLMKRFGGPHDGPIADVELYLGDVQDHIITMLQALTQCDHSLTRTHSNYLAQISIEITKSANKTNDFVGKLTFFASILVPLNIVTGLFGMNVKVPGRDEESLFWWWGIIGSMIAYSLLVVLIGRLAKVI
ncbi:hypothetical protein BJ742DRAFT_679402 [Cladochytrium replicatum]|nr:hypothetical protein BJ742DRAFT_679402 [Cladochytrium replicatum]